MKSKILLLFVLISVNSWLLSTTWHIKQDGTGNFTTIQGGINASADSDTILVYPGTFFENIDFNAKNITVASLYLTTGNEEYMYNTIIDGSQNGSCVRIMSEEDSTTVLCGFTLTNGSGSSYSITNILRGGGILIKDSQPMIRKCLIKDNYAKAGGGIFCLNSKITLAGVSIINNHSYASGGGIFMGNYSEILFDNEMLCNIYLNYAAGGCEITKTWNCPPLEVFVDTFTVMEPDDYFIVSATSTGIPLNDVTLYIQNAKLEPINADLYVSTDGNNNNNGLSEDEPLANINYALSLVKSDSLHPNAIHIADGLYSNSMNNQKFPLCMRGYVSLIGESMVNTILDAEEICMLITGYRKLDYLIKNISFINGNGNGFFASCMYITAYPQQGKFVNLENITITECQGYNRNLDLIYMNLDILNFFSHSNYCTCLHSLNSFQPEQEVIIENAYIHNNQQYDPPDPGSDARPQLSFGMLGTEPMNVTITNMELTENIQYQSDWPESSSGIGIGDNINLNLVNCTIGNNSSPGNGGAIRIGPDGQNSVVNIYNSILYGDNPGEIYIDNEFSTNPSTINIHNSLVDGGYEGIENVYSWNVVNWMEGNLDADPCWDITGDYPYTLLENSPCIDNGTTILPAGIELPEFDLAGNPRIFGETIDMGAYEFQGDPQSNDENEIVIPEITQISNYPNPFNPSTTINLDLAESGKIELVIYNIKGQKVKTLLDAYSSKGHFEIIWRGIDDNKRSVASGNYFIKLKVNGDEKAVNKCVLLK
ncbi:MAG: T9SS type A sorting domain-containing protein [Candidatus Cloacimonetes bacterium]|nr:T9SS type A sorting domain-containing protein [Candidatus Cloacimonadota bacterium]